MQVTDGAISIPTALIGKRRQVCKIYTRVSTRHDSPPELPEFKKDAEFKMKPGSDLMQPPTGSLSIS
jgi:hypothetical protein